MHAPTDVLPVYLEVRPLAKVIAGGIWPHVLVEHANCVAYLMCNGFLVTHGLAPAKIDSCLAIVRGLAN